ncbi:uncharacterized protein LOC122505058 isoform X2 [Leptopilina heterotoma]|uniref:uncharacterized protein LOC122505058 isoform X2 n=1 Tax=Leptopilina heterotoma TaxID=63436 RepID=UPI001CA9E828|nr:uncharacterized protein LOC122505058 isoform X2 [Leptopilina heterotoma]
MNIIGIENVIAIIFALTLQIVVSTRRTASERADEFNELYNKQYDVIDNHIADCFKNEAWNYIEEYVLSDDELQSFIIKINKTGRPSINYKNRKLLNPVDFSILRFFTYLESTTFQLRTATKQVESLKSQSKI